MTAQRLVEDFAKWLYERDTNHGDITYIPDNYLNEAAVFLAGELGQRLQHGQPVTKAEEERARSEFAKTQREADKATGCAACDRPTGSYLHTQPGVGGYHEYVAKGGAHER